MKYTLHGFQKPVEVLNTEWLSHNKINKTQSAKERKAEIENIICNTIKDPQRYVVHECDATMIHIVSWPGQQIF